MSPETQNDHPAIAEMPYHVFIPSEFAPDSGRCDKCGGGPGAETHQKPVDQMARIADALDHDWVHILDGLEGTFCQAAVKQNAQTKRIVDALEGILEILTQRNDWEAEKRQIDAINERVRDGQ